MVQLRPSLRWLLLVAASASLAGGAAVPASAATAPSISGLTLIDAAADQPIAAQSPLANGATLDLSKLPSRQLSIRADTSPAKVGSVVFTLDGQRVITESVAPYAIAGDGANGTDYYPWTPIVGRHTLTVTPYPASAAGGTAGTAKTITFAVTDGGQAPYGNGPVTLPGTLEAEGYDLGGEGVAYHDYDATDLGSGFRTGEGVDVQPLAGASGYGVGHVRAGEWLEYAVSIPTAGTYDLGVRFASAAAGARAHVSLDGVDVTGPMTLAGTGGWQTWTTAWARGVTLPARTTAVLRLQVDGTLGAAEVGNLDQVVVRPAAAATGVPWPATWTAAPAAPSVRYEGAVTQIGSKVYVFGGYLDSRWHVDRTYVSYDMATGAWTRLGTLPAGMPETHLGIVNDGRYVYVAGGFGGDIHADQSPSQWISDQVWRLDTQANAWTLIDHLPQPRGAGGLALIGRQLHYLSGNTADRVTNVGTHYVYDLDTGAWSTRAPLPNPKDHFSTIELDGKIYVLGGEHGHDELNEAQSDAHVYDPATDTWRRLADMPLAKSHDEGGTFVANGRIVMAGGQYGHFQATAQSAFYDPATNAWTTLSSLPAPRQGAMVREYGSRAVLALGAINTNQPQAGVWTAPLP